MRPIKELLCNNFKEVQNQYNHQRKREEMLAEPSATWWEYVDSDELPSLKSGRVYRPDTQEGLDTALCLAWRVANREVRNRVVIGASNLSSGAVSMRLLALTGRCGLSDMLEGKLDSEDWRKLTSAAAYLAEMDIQIGSFDLASTVNERTRDEALNHDQIGLLLLLNSSLSEEDMLAIAVQHDIPVVALYGLVDEVYPTRSQQFLCWGSKR